MFTFVQRRVTILIGYVQVRSFAHQKFHNLNMLALDSEMERGL